MMGIDGLHDVPAATSPSQVVVRPEAMDRRSLLVRLPSLDLHANRDPIAGSSQVTVDQESVQIAALVPAPEAIYQGVALDPSTDFRAANVFFDDEPRPYPLVGGQVLRGEFRSLRVAPLLKTTWERGTTPGSTFGPAPYNNQRLALRLWQEPPSTTQLALPEVGQFVQRLLTTGAGGVAQATAMYHVHAPGARSITFFAGNHGQSPSPYTAVTVTVYGSRPERVPEDPLSTDFSSTTFSQLLATLVLGTGSTAAQSVTVIEPGFTEYYFVANATAAAVIQYEVGCIVHYNAP